MRFMDAAASVANLSEKARTDDESKEAPARKDAHRETRAKR
jgi:hypothetical protein